VHLRTSVHVKLVYFGTPQMAVEPLRALYAAGHEILLVVSRADARRGRGSAVSASPVKAAAIELGLAVTEDPEEVLEVSADLGVVVAYGRIITPALLEHLPMVNLHFSLLPRWRGAAPVERALLAGDRETGVCVMAVEEGLDTGAVFARTSCAIDDTVTAEDLRAQLASAGTDLLIETLGRVLGAPEPQSHEGVTYARKLTAEDHRLDWDRSSVELMRIIRLGGARTTFRGGSFKVLAADIVTDDAASTDHGSPEVVSAPPGTFVGASTVATGDGQLRLLRVQPEGKSAMDAAAWANGARPLGDGLGG